LIGCSLLYTWTLKAIVHKCTVLVDSFQIAALIYKILRNKPPW
jgi:hypothetical protein